MTLRFGSAQGRREADERSREGEAYPLKYVDRPSDELARRSSLSTIAVEVFMSPVGSCCLMRTTMLPCPSEERRTMQTSRFSQQTLLRTAILSVFGLSALLAITLRADAVAIAKDPKGFQNIPWGTSLAGQPHLTLARTGQHVTEYQLKNGPPRFAETEVDSLLFSTVNGQFARVTIRYRGETTPPKDHDLSRTQLRGPGTRTWPNGPWAESAIQLAGNGDGD